jgi:hypothetical protein
MPTVKTIQTEDEILQIDAQSGEILLSTDPKEYKQIQHAKIQAFKLLQPRDFCQINGVWEAKRDGLLKILTSLPLSYAWEITDQEIKESYAKISGTLTVNTGNIMRASDALGICERTELTTGGMHFMVARAETRALKRAIETLFGSVINYYVLNNLEQTRRVS